MSFYGVTDIGTYVIGALAIILLPGPNSLFVLSVATARGVRAAFAGVLGVSVGDTVLLILTAFGAAELLRSSPLAFMVVKYLGACYLAWIGLGLWFAAWKQRGAMRLPDGVGSPVVDLTTGFFRRALVISLFNPKAILFLLSFFVQFIDPSYQPHWLPFAILGSIVMTFSLVYLSVLVFAGARLAHAVSRRPRVSTVLNSCVGCLFLWFGARLATASLN